jgi:HK97 family phage major capsid protein
MAQSTPPNKPQAPGAAPQAAPKTAPQGPTLGEVVRRQNEQIAVLTKQLGEMHQMVKAMPAPGAPAPASVFGGRNVRTGENPLASRGFSFMKMLGVITGACAPDQAKVEIDIHNRMHQTLANHDGYTYQGGHFPGQKAFLAPLATSYLHEQYVDRNFRNEMRQLVNAGMEGADYDEMNWIRRKQLGAQGYGQKTLSWLNEYLGGALVAPPEMGELIELLRNKEALVNAGARTVPLPPQGRLKYPRQTASSLTYWVGENSPITASDVGVGEITLQAKKLAVLIKAPNELIRFASPAAEALMRDDMTKSLALGLDLAGLEGQGGDNRPRGIINMPNIYNLSSSSQTANGDRIVGNDIYRFFTAVEEANAEFEGFIMRPKTMYKYYQLRSDAVAQGDAQGPFLFSLIREAGEGMAKPMLGGYPVTKSTQVSQSRAKGSASNLTYIVGGMWSDLLIGMFGAIEFSATTMGDTSFVNDQTWVKGILSADIQARHEAAFVLMDGLDITL